MALLAAKIIISFLLAVTITWFAERKSLHWGGIISSLPNVSILIMFFLSLEQGAIFTANAAIYGVYGIMGNIFLASTVIFATFYLSSIPAVLLGVLAYAINGFIAIQFLPANHFTALFSCLIVWLLFLFSWRNIPQVKVHQVIQSKTQLIILQFFLIAFFIILTTSLAPLVGEAWSGIIGAYPSITTTIGFIILLKYGGAELRSFFAAAIFGWLATAVYIFSIAFTYPSFGVWSGTLLSFGIALVTVIVSKLIQKRCICFNG